MFEGVGNVGLLSHVSTSASNRQAVKSHRRVARHCLSRRAHFADLGFELDEISEHINAFDDLVDDYASYTI